MFLGFVTLPFIPSTSKQREKMSKYRDYGLVERFADAALRSYVFPCVVDTYKISTDAVAKTAMEIGTKLADLLAAQEEEDYQRKHGKLKEEALSGQCVVTYNGIACCLRGEHTKHRIEW